MFKPRSVRLMKKLLQIITEQIPSIVSVVVFTMFYTSCESHAVISPAHAAIAKTSGQAGATNPRPVQMASAEAILERPQVPILCYHQIRDWRPSDSKRAKDYIVPVNNFRQQIKLLADNGYHTILPDQLYDYLLKGSPLPLKPIMISFDDTRAEQYSIARQELDKYGF